MTLYQSLLWVHNTLDKLACVDNDDKPAMLCFAQESLWVDRKEVRQLVVSLRYDSVRDATILHRHVIQISGYTATEEEMLVALAAIRSYLEGLITEKLGFQQRAQQTLRDQLRETDDRIGVLMSVLEHEQETLQSRPS